MDSFVKHYSYSFIANQKTIDDDDESYQCRDDDDDDDSQNTRTNIKNTTSNTSVILPECTDYHTHKIMLQSETLLDTRERER